MTSSGKYSDGDATLSDEAIDWLVKLNSGREREEDRLAFDMWRRRSPAHELAAQEAEQIWHGLGFAGDQLRKTERKSKLTRRAALGGMMLLGGGFLLERTGIVGAHLFPDHVTDIGERRSVTLEDGSTVLLNGDTSLSTNYSPTGRLLTLHSGQAVFAVAHDESRPFIVEANGGNTRAVGTVFDVDIRSEDVVVTVLEGKVSISTGESTYEAVTAEAEQRVRYTASAGVGPAEAIDSDTETAWRRGKLIFNGRPLGDVVAEIERHRRGRIIVADSGLRSLEITGVFNLDQPDEILQTIEATLPVRVTRLPFVTILR